MPPSPSCPMGGRTVVLVGMPGAGKTAVGRRLAARLGLPFYDADAEVEIAAGMPITEIFARYGEAHFRAGERRVIARLLAGPPIVLATGGGAFADPATRALIKATGAITLWLRCDLETLLRRVAGRQHRPLFHDADPLAVLTRLMAIRHPFYAEADITVHCRDEAIDTTVHRVYEALANARLPERLRLDTRQGSYEIVIGPGLLARAGGLLGPVLPSRRAVVVSDATVAALHLPRLRHGLETAGFTVLGEIVVPAGEAAKDFARLGEVLEAMVAAGLDRRTTVIALGGGVVGDLAGFAAAIALRGVPFVQVPTTLLAQVDAAVGGKTGINLRAGKNLVGAFYQPRIVLADSDTLATLPLRERRAGYAEVAKHGLLAGEFWQWCEAEGEKVVAGDSAAIGRAVSESCRIKGAIVAADEREEQPEGGRALLNLGHTFAHALEAESGYDGTILHGEAVAVGLGLAARLSLRLGLCESIWPQRIIDHLAVCGLPARLTDLPRRFSAAALIARMGRDKKNRDGALRFVLLRRPGECLTVSDVSPAVVAALLHEEGAL